MDIAIPEVSNVLGYQQMHADDKIACSCRDQGVRSETVDSLIHSAILLSFFLLFFWGLSAER